LVDDVADWQRKEDKPKHYKGMYWYIGDPRVTDTRQWRAGPRNEINRESYRWRDGHQISKVYGHHHSIYIWTPLPDAHRQLNRRRF
jgi:hypothetical protein